MFCCQINFQICLGTKFLGLKLFLINWTHNINHAVYSTWNMVHGTEFNSLAMNGLHSTSSCFWQVVKGFQGVITAGEAPKARGESDSIQAEDEASVFFLAP